MPCSLLSRAFSHVGNRLFHLAITALLPAAVLILLGRASISAQSTSWGPNDNGIRAAFSSAYNGGYAVSGIDTVNLYNGRVSLRLPIGKIGARGTVEYTPSVFIGRTFVLRSYQYWSYPGTPPGWSDPVYKVISEGYNDSYDYSNFQPGLLPFVLIGRRTRDNDPNPSGTIPPSYQSCYTLTKLYLRLPGSEIELRDVATGGQQHYEPTFDSLNRGSLWRSVDGSQILFKSDADIQDETCNDNGFAAMNGINMVHPSGYLLMPDGSRYRVVGGVPKWVSDANGNTMVFGETGEITDSIGRKYQLSNGVTYKNHDGVSESVGVTTGSLSTALRSDFAAAGVKDLQTLFRTVHLESPTAVFDPIVTKSIHLPNGLEYRFFYTAYGELARIELPGGGIIEYDFAPADGTYGNSVTATTPPQIYRVATERRVYDAGGHLQQRETFIFSSVTAVTIYDADNNVVQRERHTFVGSVYDDIVWQGWYQAPDNGREYITEMLDAAGNVLRRSEYTWRSLDLNGIPTEYQPGNTHPTNLDCALTGVKTTLKDTNQVSTATFTYDGYGNKTDSYEYDFGAPGTGSPGPLIRRTHVDFNYDPAYIQTSGPRFLKLVSRQWVSSDAAGVNRQSTTEFEYDHYQNDSRHAPLIDRPGIIGLCIKLDNDGISCLEASDSSYVSRGNLTQTISFHDLQNNGSIISSFQYDVAGNVVKTIDGRGYETTLDFRDNFGGSGDVVESGGDPNNAAPALLNGKTSYGFPFSVTNALGQKVFSKFNYFIGKPVGVEDVNRIVSSTNFNDVLDRPKQTIGASNVVSTKTQSALDYDDLNRTITATSDLNDFNDNGLKVKTLYDGLGRKIESRTYEDSENYIAVRTEYDALGRAYKVSNPFRPLQIPTPTPVWTITEFDALGRVKTVTTPDGAVVTTSYSGNTVTVTDQAGRKRRSVIDSLGRLVRVDEPDRQNGNLDDQGAPVQSTFYEYDALGNLRKVTQGSQQRFFMYDSLSRLIRARNVEQDFNPSLNLNDPISDNSQWSVAYSYDQNGNLAQKTDARGVVSTYTYDALNRNTGISYSNDPTNTPAVTRTYDNPANGANGLGRVWQTQTAGVSRTTIDGYDALGRPTTQQQQFYVNGWGEPFNLGLAYDKAGHVLTLTYPSNHSVSYNYDSAGRLSTFTGNLGDAMQRTYASGINYSPFGGLTKEQFGSQQPLYHHLSYNVRGQLYYIGLGATNSDWGGDYGQLIYYYGNAYSFGGSGADNNGNISLIDNHLPGGTTIHDHYSYDWLNRLSEISEEDTAFRFNQTYDYDRYGNRTAVSGINNKPFTVNPETNRLGVPTNQSGTMHYDSAGNLDIDTYSGLAASRIYDAENRMTKETQANSYEAGTYTYDGDGRRVKRKVGAVETRQIYGVGGELLAEYAANALPTNPQKEYGYRNGELLITAEPLAGERTNFARASNGGSASASSAYAGLAPSGGIDGNRMGSNYGQNTTWGGATGTFPQWLQIDFNGSKTIDEVDVFTLQNNYQNPSEPTQTMTFSQYGITAFTVEYWTGTTWATVPGGNISGNNKVWRTIMFSPITTSKIKVTTTASASGWSEITEVEAWGSAPAQPTNVALASNGGVASASSAYTPGNWGAGTTNNGDRKGDATNGSWNDAAPANSFPDWLEIDFNGSKTIGEIDVFTVQDNWQNPSEPTESMTFSNYGLTAFDVQYWDGSAWATIPGGSVTGNNKVWRKFTFSPITTSKIKVLGNAAPDGYSRLTEVEAWTTISGSSSSTNIHWLVTDQLGTPRMVFDQSGALASVSRHDYLPFGEEVGAGTGGRTQAQGYGASDGVRQKFIQKERDIETGLDFFEARYFASIQGRFTSTDPLYFQVMMAIDPQRFNLYAYSRNNPLKFIDPSGEKLYLRGNDEWLRTKVLYEMAGDQENFDKYFEIVDGQVVARSGVDTSGANSGVQELLGLVNATENYVYYAGNNAEDALGQFDGINGKDKQGNPAVKPLSADNKAVARRDFNTADIVGTNGRYNSLHPAALSNGDPVFMTIAYNTNGTGYTQTTIHPDNYDKKVYEREAQASGLGQVVKPVSTFIHESAENRFFSRIAMSYRYAHQYAQHREAMIRRELGITGGFAGGGLESTPANTRRPK